MEIRTIQIGMFEMMGIVVLVIYFGQWIREKLPVLKKYCIPSAVVGGTIFSILTCILYMTGIVQFEWENQSVRRAASWSSSSPSWRLFWQYCRTRWLWA